MEGNTWLYFVAAIVPMITGFIWYNPKLFGNTWMKAAKLTQSDVEGGNMPLIFGLSYAFSILLALILNYFVHHGMQIAGSVLQDPEMGVAADSQLGVLITDYITKLDTRYATFGHGVVHGLIIAIGLVLPIFVSNSLFERKGFKYILVNWGYWALTIALMGGVLSKWF